MNYEYRYLMEYLPKRYSATMKQENDREVIYDFKNGYCSLSLMNTIVECIKEIKNETGGNNWRVCFIPASTHHKTACRYQKLATFIEKETGIACDYHTILPIQDQESGHITGKKTNPAENFNIKTSDVAGKKIIVIDDIITRGRTFQMVAEKLETMGAASVTGLFLAKTFNPDYHPHYDPTDDYDSEDYYDPSDYYEEEETYDNYNGSYAQDVEGWSDQDIDDVFDGDPDAYWNID